MDNRKLIETWKIVGWLDSIRWSEEESKRALIPGPIYENLEDRQKILTHWITYITDQQRPAQDVWMRGGPIFAEIVSTYATERRNSSLNILGRFTVPGEEQGSIDAFRSKTQRMGGEVIKYTPRFGMHILSIARTLHFLEEREGDLVRYLSDHWDFIDRAKRSGSDNRTSRIAYLLYLLTYDNVNKGVLSFHKQLNKIEKYIQGYEKRLKRVLSDQNELEIGFERWSAKDSRYHKRLWAALRDYLKPNSNMQNHFAKALNDLGNKAFEGFVKDEHIEILNSLELPGDIWNLRFFGKVFREVIESPKDLRVLYDKLKNVPEFKDKLYPEQFDVSFSFSPYMCDEAMEEFCPFRANSRIREFCIHDITGAASNRLCPVVMMTCGFIHRCTPDGCQIRHGITHDLCPGCSLEVTGA